MVRPHSVASIERRRLGRVVARPRLEVLEDRCQPSVQVASLAAFQAATAGSADVNRQSFSDDGQFLVFTSRADDVTPNDRDGQIDVFLYDRSAATVTLVSKDKSGTAVGAYGPDSTVGSLPIISGDGRYVVFASLADAGSIVTSGTVADTGYATCDLFRYDRLTGAVALVSRDPTGNAGTAGSDAAVSGDGNVVAFASAGSLAVGTTVSRASIYAYDFAADKMTLVSRGAGGGSGNENSFNPVVSRDGSTVAFSTLATNIVAPGTDANDRQDLYLTRLSDGATVLVSRDPGGHAAGIPDQYTYSQTGISDDGNLVAFVADTDLSKAPVPGDTRDVFYTFLYDRTADAVTLVSRTLAGEAAGHTGNYQDAAISGDGKYVAFVSDSKYVVPNDATNSADVFLLDRTTDSIVLVSRNAAGDPLDDSSGFPSLSRDGKTVAFATYAGDYPGGTRYRLQVAVFDRTTGAVTLASRNPGGTGGNNAVGIPVVSGDGTAVAFPTTANDLVGGDPGQSADVFVYDRKAQTVAVASSRNGPASATANAGSTVFNGSLSARQLGTSADGRYTVFVSNAGNLVPNDLNSSPDVYVYDRLTASVTLVSRDMSGNAAGVDNFIVGPAAAISRDGNWVTFSSGSDTIVPNDTNLANDVFLFNRLTGVVSLISHRTGEAGTANPFAGSYQPTISDDGRFVAYASRADLTGENPGFATAAYLYDRVADSTVLVSRTLAGGAADVQLNNSFYAAVTVSGDGFAVVFQTTTPGVTAGDANGKSDVFRYDRGSNAVTLVSRNAAGGVGNDGSFYPQVSRDGTVVTFHSLASDLGGIDGAKTDDLFVYDATTNAVSVVSQDTTGTNRGSYEADGVLSGDGKFVAFTSSGSLLPADTNGEADIYLYDRGAGALTLVSHSPTGAAVNGFSVYPAVSDDGGIVAFRSTSPDLASGAASYTDNVFFFDRSSGFVGLVSQDAGGKEGNNGSDLPGVSGDGKVIVFNTDATAFDADDRNGATDVAVVVLSEPAVTVGPILPNPRNAPVDSVPVAFDEAVTGFDVADLTLVRVDASGTAPVPLTAALLMTADNKLFTLSGLASLTAADGAYTLTLTAAGSGVANAQSNLPLATDAAGSFVVDATFPTVVGLSPAQAQTKAATALFNLNFSEPVSGVDPADFKLTTTGSLTGAAVVEAHVVGGNGSGWVVTVSTGSGVGTIQLDLVDNDTVQDAAANPLGGAGAGTGSFTGTPALAVDPSSPTVVSVIRNGGSPTAAASATFTVTFSEPVTNVALSDFTPVVAGLTGTPAVTAFVPSGDRTTYTVTVSTGAGDGALGLNVGTGGGIADDLGNPLTTAFSGGEHFTIDRTAPAVTVSPGSGQPNPATSAPVLFDVRFSDPVTGFDPSDVVLSGTAGAAAVAVTGSGTAYTLAVSGMTGPGSITVAVKAGTTVDAAGNPSAVASATLVFSPPISPPPATTPETLPVAPPPVATTPPPVSPTSPPASPASPLPPAAPTSPLHLATQGGAAGSSPVVQVVNPDGSTRFTVAVFESTFTGGVNVALGDVTGDGVDDVIFGAKDGGGPRVRVFDGRSGDLLADFFAFDPNDRGGVVVAAHLVNGIAEVLAASGPGGAPLVRTFRGIDGTALGEVLAFEAAFGGGVSLTVGDVTGDGVQDVVAGAGVGGAPRVRVFGGANGTTLADFYAGDSSDRSGVRVATADVNGDGRADLLATAGSGATPRTRTYVSRATPPVFQDEATDPGTLSGAFVG